MHSNPNSPPSPAQPVPTTSAPAQATASAQMAFSRAQLGNTNVSQATSSAQSTSRPSSSSAVTPANPQAALLTNLISMLIETASFDMPANTNLQQRLTLLTERAAFRVPDFSLPVEQMPAEVEYYYHNMHIYANYAQAAMYSMLVNLQNYLASQVNTSMRNNTKSAFYRELDTLIANATLFFDLHQNWSHYQAGLPHSPIPETQLGYQPLYQLNTQKLNSERCLTGDRTKYANACVGNRERRISGLKEVLPIERAIKIIRSRLTRLAYRQTERLIQEALGSRAQATAQQTAATSHSLPLSRALPLASTATTSSSTALAAQTTSLGKRPAQSSGKSTKKTKHSTSATQASHFAPVPSSTLSPAQQAMHNNPEFLGIFTDLKQTQTNSLSSDEQSLVRALSQAEVNAQIQIPESAEITAIVNEVESLLSTAPDLIAPASQVQSIQFSTQAVQLPSQTAAISFTSSSAISFSPSSPIASTSTSTATTLQPQPQPQPAQMDDELDLVLSWLEDIDPNDQN